MKRSNNFTTSQLYGPTGYFYPAALIDYCRKNRIFRCCVIGGRGTGKTIGFLQWAVKSGVFFAYTRRHANQAEMFRSATLSPLKAVNRNIGTDFSGYRDSKDVIAICPTAYDKDGKRKSRPTEPAVGLVIPLSTGGGLKGFDGLDVEILVTDEIVPDATEVTLPHEGEAYRSVYETINRNRESEGMPPLLHLAFGNSNRVANPFVVEFGYIPVLLSMKENGETVRRVNDGELIILMDDSPVSARKKEQAAYSDGSKYARMAIGNEFTDDHFSKIQRVPHAELIPKIKFGDLYISLHKAGGWYVSLQNPGGKVKEYKGDSIGLQQLKFQHKEFIAAYWLEQVKFSEEMAESLFQQYLSIR